MGQNVVRICQNRRMFSLYEYRLLMLLLYVSSCVSGVCISQDKLGVAPPWIASLQRIHTQIELVLVINASILSYYIQLFLVLRFSLLENEFRQVLMITWISGEDRSVCLIMVVGQIRKANIWKYFIHNYILYLWQPKFNNNGLYNLII